mgnify:CR=1 FL=1
MVTVVGEAGLGKSRLLYEFENWLMLRAEEVAKALPYSAGKMLAIPLKGPKFEEELKDVDLVVNCVSLDEENVIAPELLEKNKHLLVYDTNYQETKLVRDAKAAGVKGAVNGIKMLAYQGIFSAYVWSEGRMPDRVKDVPFFKEMCEALYVAANL